VGYAFEYADFMDLSQLGAFVTKSITREERPGNEPAPNCRDASRGCSMRSVLPTSGSTVSSPKKVPQIPQDALPGHRECRRATVTPITQKTCAAMDSLDCVAGVELNVSLS